MEKYLDVFREFPNLVILVAITLSEICELC